MAEFVLLKNNIFESNGNVKQQVAGTAIGTKFAPPPPPPPYACIYMDEVETEIVKKQELNPLVWFRCMIDIFFIWNHSDDELLENLNKFK